MYLAKISKLILGYYNFQMRISSRIIISNWQRLQRGIITGCTLSATSFILTINMIVKSAEIECQGLMMKTGVHQPPIRAYMDNLTVTTTSVMGSRWTLCSLEKLLAWARMKFKPAKSRSLNMENGRTADNFHFSLSETMMPTLLEFRKEPRKDFQQYIESHQHCLNHRRQPGVMAGQSGQIRSPRPFQSVDISARGTPQDSVAVICLWLPNDNSGNHGKEN